jgi:hypothetical protein
LCCSNLIQCFSNSLPIDEAVEETNVYSVADISVNHNTMNINEVDLKVHQELIFCTEMYGREIVKNYLTITDLRYHLKCDFKGGSC